MAFLPVRLHATTKQSKHIAFFTFAMILSNLVFAQTIPIDQQYYVHRALAGDTLHRVGFRFLKEPNSKAALQTLLAANEALPKNTSLKTTALTVNTPIKIPTAIMLTEAANAVITQFAGDVKIQNTLDSTPTPAGTNIPVNEGATIILGATGRAVLAFPDESRMELLANTKLSIVELKRYAHTPIYLIEVKLNQGRADAYVNPNRHMAGRFSLQSRRTVTGVRGTVFRLEDTATDNDSGNAVIEVLKGEVTFSAANTSVSVAGGSGSFLTPTGPAKPVPLLPEPIWLSTKTQLDVGEDMIPAALPEGAAKGIIELTESKAGAITHTYPTSPNAPLITPENLPLGPYQLTMRGIDINSLQGQTLKTNVTLVSKPFAPAQVFLEPDQKKLRWMPEEQAYMYAIEIQAQNGQTSEIKTRTAFQNIPIDTLKPGKYLARVASIGIKPLGNSTIKEKQGGFSPWFAFNLP